jgi:hypothetical protein
MSNRPEGTGVPLICIPWLFTRVDNTPPNEREMFPNYTVDKSGEPIPEPHKHPEKIALEPNPNLAFEHFDEYWRKIHGSKWAHKESPDDPSTDYVLMYNQVHRVAGGPSSQYSPPYKPPLAADGKLSVNPAAEVPPYVRPKWDGMAHVCYKSLSETEKIFRTNKYVTKIIPDEGIFTRAGLPLAAAEYIIIPGPEIPAPVVVKRYYRNSGSREGFQKRLLWDHADFVCSKPDTQRYVTRYALLLNVGPNDKNNPLYHEAGQKVDALSMMSFRNMTECEWCLGGDDYRSIDAIENEFVDKGQSEWFTAITYNVINKIGKEVATNRNLTPRM